MKTNFYLASLSVVIAIFLFTGCGNSNKNKDMKKEFDAFIKKYEDTIAKLDKEANLAYWNASISGKSEDFQKNADVENLRNKKLSNKDDFALLKKIKESNQITDSTQKRELDVMYNIYLEKQADEKKMESIVNLENEIEKKFNTFRTVIGKDTLTDNKIEEITVVGNGTKLSHKVIGKISWSPVPGLVYIDVPSNVLDKYVTVLKLKLDKPLKLYRGHGGFE